MEGRRAYVYASVYADVCAYVCAYVAAATWPPLDAREASPPVAASAEARVARERRPRIEFLLTRAARELALAVRRHLGLPLTRGTLAALAALAALGGSLALALGLLDSRDRRREEDLASAESGVGRWRRAGRTG